MWHQRGVPNFSSEKTFRTKFSDFQQTNEYRPQTRRRGKLPTRHVTWIYLPGSLDAEVSRSALVSRRGEAASV